MGGGGNHIASHQDTTMRNAQSDNRQVEVKVPRWKRFNVVIESSA